MFVSFEYCHFNTTTILNDTINYNIKQIIYIVIRNIYKRTLNRHPNKVRQQRQMCLSHTEDHVPMMYA